jgi:enoyl-CoA hydratase/carnithine racemase
MEDSRIEVWAGWVAVGVAAGIAVGADIVVAEVGTEAGQPED